MSSIQATPAAQLVQALQAIEDGDYTFPTEPQAGIRRRTFCFVCPDGVPRCPTCCYQGERIVLDTDQTSELFDAVYGLEEINGFYTKEQWEAALEAFRSLLLERAPWYDGTSLQMIQACYQNLCMRGGIAKKVVLAIDFFEKEYVRVSKEESQF